MRTSVRREIDALGAELDAIRTEVENSRGGRDAAYIRRTILFQRTLDAGARLLIFGSRSRAGWWAGTVALAVAKSIENMEIGHNVGHGQWDWMNDPEIHSNTWEWDMAGLSSQWRYSHNYRHHMYTNVLDVDDDLGFGIMRVSRDVVVAAAKSVAAVAQCAAGPHLRVGYRAARPAFGARARGDGRRARGPDPGASRARSSGRS